MGHLDGLGDVCVLYVSQWATEKLFGLVQSHPCDEITPFLNHLEFSVFTSSYDLEPMSVAEKAVLQKHRKNVTYFRLTGGLESAE